jgi:hypothetical protein
MMAAERPGPEAHIVTVFPDRMERYFSTELFSRGNCPSLGMMRASERLGLIVRIVDRLLPRSGRPRYNDLIRAIYQPDGRPATLTTRGARNAVPECGGNHVHDGAWMSHRRAPDRADRLLWA